MPALPNYPNVLKLRTLFQVGADSGVSTTLHFTYSGTAPANAICDDIAGTWLGSAATNMAPAMETGNALLGATVTDLTTPTSGFGESLATTAGTRGSSPLPAGACVLVNQPFARRYRGGKSRTYWPFGEGGDLVTAQDWNPTAVVDFTDAIQLTLDSVLGVAFGGTTIVSLCSISYYHGFTPVTNPITGRTRDVPTVRSVAIAPDVISTFSINPKVASQRRRNLHG